VAQEVQVVEVILLLRRVRQKLKMVLQILVVAVEEEYMVGPRPSFIKVAPVAQVSSFSKCNQHKVDLSLGHSQALVFGDAQQEFLMTK